jgi:hypothetical protein
MAFDAAELSVLAYANGFTLWHYRTDDSADSVLGAGAGYFAAANELLRAGDRIMVNLPAGGRPGLIDLIVTATGTAGTVSVAAA